MNLSHRGSPLLFSVPFRIKMMELDNLAYVENIIQQGNYYHSCLVLALRSQCMYC